MFPDPYRAPNFMKACIILQNQYSKIGHAVALHLKKHYGVDEFCAYVFSPDAKKFIAQQRDFVYDPILVDHELHAASKNVETDSSYIQYFEKTYGPPYLWQYLNCDRKLMMSMGPKEESTAVIDPLYTHEELLKIFQVRAKAIEKMLQKARPNIIVFFAIGVLAHFIIYYVAKKMGIQVLNCDFPRLENRMCLSEDYRRLTGVTTIAQQWQKESNHTTPYHAEAATFIKNFRVTGSLQLHYMEHYKRLYEDKIEWKTQSYLRLIWRSLRFLFILTGNWLRNGRWFIYGATAQNPLLFILHKLKYYFRLLRGLKDLYRALLPGESYVFYPLHFEPEIATLLLSPFYFEQIQLIKYIARSLPIDFKLYVKEHPVMQYKRPRSFYKEILKIPNVKLINPSIPSITLIRDCKLVTTITSSVGWEAALWGKPVITFGEVFYNDLSFVHRIHDIETLPEVIRSLLKEFHYDEAEVTNFLAAALKDSFPFDYTSLWYENDITKLKDHPHVAEFCKRLIEKVHI